MKKVEFQLLIEKYAAGKCSPEEEIQVEKYFDECQNNPGGFSEESTVIGKRMFQKIVTTIGQRKRKRRQRIGLKIAASLLLLISAGSIIHLLNKEEVYMAKTGFGEKKEFTLSDGTIVSLNSASRLTYTSNYNQDNRELNLIGEAYFEVTSNQEKPFIVHTKELNTKVHGTTFNINAYDDNEEITVSVTSGKVNVFDNQTVNEFLEVNQALTYNTLDKSHVKKQSNTENATVWKNNVLLLDDYNLETTCKILEKWFDVKIDIIDENLKSELIHGTFTEPNLKDVLTSIQFSIGIDIDYKNENHILFKNKKQL